MYSQVSNSNNATIVYKWNFIFANRVMGTEVMGTNRLQAPRLSVYTTAPVLWQPFTPFPSFLFIWQNRENLMGKGRGWERERRQIPTDLLLPGGGGVCIWLTVHFARCATAQPHKGSVHEILQSIDKSQVWSLASHVLEWCSGCLSEYSSVNK